MLVDGCKAFMCNSPCCCIVAPLTLMFLCSVQRVKVVSCFFFSLSVWRSNSVLAVANNAFFCNYPMLVISLLIFMVICLVWCLRMVSVVAMVCVGCCL